MPELELISFPDDHSLARAAAGQWLALLRKHAHTSASSPYCVALAGGRIAHRFLTEVAAQAPKAGGLPDCVHFFWGDERCVPPTDPESNFALAHSLMLQPLGVPPSRIHRVRGELPPPAASLQAAEELAAVAPRNAQGLPIFDLVFLGMGEDGHIASLFPGEPAQALSDSAIFRPVLAVKPPPQRITLGYPVLAAARQAWVLASGRGKEAALREALAPSASSPLGRLLSLRSNTRILTDLEAGQGPRHS